MIKNGLDLYGKQIKNIKIGDVFLHRVFGELKVVDLEPTYKSDLYRDVYDIECKHIGLEDNMGNRHVFPRFINNKGENVEPTIYKCHLVKKIDWCSDEFNIMRAIVIFNNEGLPIPSEKNPYFKESFLKHHNSLFSNYNEVYDVYEQIMNFEEKILGNEFYDKLNELLDEKNSKINSLKIELDKQIKNISLNNDDTSNEVQIIESRSFTNEILLSFGDDFDQIYNNKEEYKIKLIDNLYNRTEKCDELIEKYGFKDKDELKINIISQFEKILDKLNKIMNYNISICNKNFENKKEKVEKDFEKKIKNNFENVLEESKRIESKYKHLFF